MSSTAFAFPFAAFAPAISAAMAFTGFAAGAGASTSIASDIVVDVDDVEVALGGQLSKYMTGHERVTERVGSLSL